MILGVGELLWDIFPDGRKVAGGAPFNFAFHCHQLGHPAAVVSRVGDDELGRELRAEVARLGMSDEFIQTDPKDKTGTVTVSVGTDGQPTYTFGTRPWERLEWSPIVADAARRATVVCFGTLALRGKVGGATVRKLAQRVQGHGGLAVYDVNLRLDDRPDERSAFQSDWLKVNDAEFGPLTQTVGDGIDDGVPIGDERQLLKYLEADTPRPNRTLIITRGSAGADVWTGDGRCTQRGVPVSVVDTVGAGDAFTAAMVCLHREGKPLAECARFAVRYAAKVCEHQGAIPMIDRTTV